MYTLKTTKQFEKDWKLCVKRGYDMTLLETVIKLLMESGTLPANYKPHKLSGNREGEWECHITPNWLLIWEQDKTELTLLMLNTGTHQDLFSK